MRINYTVLLANNINFLVETLKSVSELEAGEKGIIATFDDSNDISLRLQEMGIIPGEVVKVLRRAPMGDPVEVRIKEYNLSLRQKEADLIKIRQ